MRILDPSAQEVLRNPRAFVWQTLKAFRANQGLLLAGAVAYYALLSIVPLLILSVIALSHLTEQADVLATIGRYLEWLLPGQSVAIIAELDKFLTHSNVTGWVLFATVLNTIFLLFGTALHNFLNTSISITVFI